MKTDVIVVGAGLSGLVAATELGTAGHQVLLVDKAKSVGGRLATRRIGPAVLDHGAQFFTTRSPEFTDAVAQWIDDDVVSVWCHGFQHDDGYPRYRVDGGMNALAKHLRAELPATVTFASSHRVDAVIPLVDHLVTTYDGGSREPDEATAVVLSAPVPQSLEILRAGGVRLSSDQATALGALDYHKVIALLATLDRAAPFGPTGAQQRPDDATFSMVVDNATKGISPEPAATFHTAHARSAELWARTDDEILAELLPAADERLGPDCRIVDVQVKRWRYAGPRNPSPDRCAVVGPAATPIVLCGDAFGGSKVEGAYLSGRAAAGTLETLAPPPNAA